MLYRFVSSTDNQRTYLPSHYERSDRNIPHSYLHIRPPLWWTGYSFYNFPWYNFLFHSTDLYVYICLWFPITAKKSTVFGSVNGDHPLFTELLKHFFIIFDRCIFDLFTPAVHDQLKFIQLQDQLDRSVLFTPSSICSSYSRLWSPAYRRSAWLSVWWSLCLYGHKFRTPTLFHLFFQHSYYFSSCKIHFWCLYYKISPPTITWNNLRFSSNIIQFSSPKW